MRNLLLTGVTGFIGSHLLKAISGNPDFTHIELILLSSRPIDGFKTILHKDYTFSKQDFIDNGINSIDGVIHLGAYTPKVSSEADDPASCNQNIFTLYHLLCQLPTKPDIFIFLSTLDVYQASDEKITEESFTEPASLYGWSKLYGEKMIEQWAKREKVILQVLRIGHIYGSGEGHYKKIIPSTIKKAKLNQSIEIFTEGHELRSFLHVRDCVEAILCSLQLKEYEGPINIVSERPLSIRQIVEIIVNKINPSLSVAVSSNSNMRVKNSVFDNSKMKKFLVSEKIVFEEGIEEEIRSYNC